jgi:hypothetical protein
MQRVSGARTAAMVPGIFGLFPPPSGTRLGVCWLRVLLADESDDVMPVAGASGLGSDAFSPVAGVVAPFRRKIPARENCGCPHSEALGVLMNGGLQLGKKQLHSRVILRSHCVGTKFPDAIIEATSPQAHKKNPVSRIKCLF